MTKFRNKSTKFIPGIKQVRVWKHSTTLLVITMGSSEPQTSTSSMQASTCWGQSGSSSDPKEFSYILLKLPVNSRKTSTENYWHNSFTQENTETLSWPFILSFRPGRAMNFFCVPLSRPILKIQVIEKPTHQKQRHILMVDKWPESLGLPKKFTRVASDSPSFFRGCSAIQL